MCGHQSQHLAESMRPKRQNENFQMRQTTETWPEDDGFAISFTYKGDTERGFVFHCRSLKRDCVSHQNKKTLVHPTI